MNARFLTAAAAAIAILWPAQSFALAALAAGAVTSCAITATNPVQRRIQVNCDPFAVRSYGITMFYPTDKLTIVSVIGLNGYGIDDTAGQEGGRKVFGSFPITATPPLEEVDVYAIIFQLNEGLPLDTILNFDVADDGDFINAIDPATGQTRTYSGIYDEVDNPNGLRPSFDIGSIARGSIIPEPTALALFAVPAAIALRRPRSA